MNQNQQQHNQSFLWIPIDYENIISIRNANNNNNNEMKYDVLHIREVRIETDIL